MRATLALLFAICLSGCQCPPAPDMLRLPDHDLSTPENALEYFREAVRRNDSHHEFHVFSRAMKDRVKEREGKILSLGNYILVRDDVLERIKARVGSIENITVGEARYSSDSPFLAEVDVSSGARKLTIEMIQEMTYDVYFPFEPPIGGHLELGTEPATIQGGILHLKIPLAKAPLEGDAEVYRVVYFREWKILWLENVEGTEGIGELIDRRLAEEKTKAEKIPQ